jgi:hypothetical protein
MIRALGLKLEGGKDNNDAVARSNQKKVQQTWRHDKGKLVGIQ